MKNYLVHLFITGAAFCAAAYPGHINAQKPEGYSADIEQKIRQVETHLGGPVHVEGQPIWILKERMAYYKVHGLSIAVVHNYTIEWARGYGWADEAEKRPVTPQTLFQAASISKSLNAVGVLKLAQEGKINLDLDINTYLTTWKFPYDSITTKKKITITNLLNHTAGLTVHGFPGYSTSDTLPTLTEILDGKKPANSPAIRSQFEPGLRSEYSGGGVTISQLIVMDVTKQPYDRFMWNNVLKPLGMTGSSFTQPPNADKRALLATAYKADGSEIKGKYHIYPEQAAAGLWTNPTDLCRYIIETQLSLQGKSSKVLSPEYTKRRLTPYANNENAALGVFINKFGGLLYFQHSGGNEGFRCQYFGSMEDGNGVVVMVNSDNGSIVTELINSVATVYGWKDFYKPETKKMVELSNGQLKLLEGKYKLDKGRPEYIQIKAVHNGIILKQGWDNREISFLPESELDFFSTDFHFPLKFTRDQRGDVTQVLAFDRDLWTRVQE